MVGEGDTSVVAMVLSFFASFSPNSLHSIMAFSLSESSAEGTGSGSTAMGVRAGSPVATGSVADEALLPPVGQIMVGGDVADGPRGNVGAVVGPVPLPPAWRRTSKG